MRLIADRFVAPGDGEEGSAFDLSNGAAVTLTIDEAGNATEQKRWLIRCDRFFKLRHPSIARLADYGLVGETHRFEAWYVLNGRPAIVPGACDVTMVERPEIGAIAEMFGDVGSGRLRAAAIWGPEGSGVRTAIHELAREARLSGLIPVASSSLTTDLADLLRGRSLLLIDRQDEGSRWRRPLEWLIRVPGSHVVLFAGRAEVAGVPGVALKRLSVEALMRAVQPQPADGEAMRQVKSAARRSNGIPGRFISLLSGSPPAPMARPASVGRPRAAERLAVYGEDEIKDEKKDECSVLPWPVASELTALRLRVDTAIEHLKGGRRAAGDRLLRQGVGGLARRGDWSYAARGQLSLAASLLRRGRPRAAQEALVEAKEYAARGGNSLLAVALLSGVAWTDLGKLNEAQAVLQAAVAAAREEGDPEARASSCLALSRCLFWRGEYREAGEVLSAIEPLTLSAATQVSVAVAASRVAVGRRAHGEAVAKAATALELALRLNEPPMVAQAAYAAAFAHLSMGDRLALAHHVSACVQAARAAHDPLRALRARLIEAESARRAGSSAPAAALLGRIRRLPASSFPVTVGARCALLADLVSLASIGSAGDVVKRHVTATGLDALALFAPETPTERDRYSQAAVDDSVEILQCCQNANDEEAVLAEVCRRLRARLRAAAIAFFSADGGPLARDGGRVDAAIVPRIVSARQAIAPHLLDGRMEGGVPVKYGGETIGALVGRWPQTLGAMGEDAAATVLPPLILAATAAAPALAAVLARRRQRREGEVDEIAGLGAALSDVREAVERAALAPFAVLIEGETGSGKELVARALHRRSPRRARPLCTLNCAALPDDLVEAELFGHSRGAFTGAIAERHGIFEEAHTGTLFLDEVGELSLRAQAKILRVIQEGELRRVGENVARRIDVRIVAATNRDLKQEVAAGRFRLDLLYRLDVIRIRVPPLRDRRQDIAVLAERFWRDATERVDSRATLSSATLAAMARYDWPGNVRELQNVVADLAVRSPRRGVVPPTALSPVFQETSPAGSRRLDEARRIFDEQFVRAALVRSGGHRSRAARELGITRPGLTKLMTRLGISEA